MESGRFSESYERQSSNMSILHGTELGGRPAAKKWLDKNLTATRDISQFGKFRCKS